MQKLINSNAVAAATNSNAVNTKTTLGQKGAYATLFVTHKSAAIAGATTEVIINGLVPSAKAGWTAGRTNMKDFLATITK